MTQITCLILSLWLVPTAHAVTESRFESEYRDKVLPFYQAGHIARMIGHKGARLRYIRFEHPNSIGAIVISAGYNESFRKYAEVAYDLYQEGFSIYILDHRGQGHSSRFLRNPFKGYIDNFDHFVFDLKKFVNTVVPTGPRYLLAHSMGGAIGALYSESYPEDFKAVVLSSPMLEIQLGRPEWLASIQLLGLLSLGQGKAYAPGTGYYDPAALEFSGNTLTSSRARFEAHRQILIERPDLFLAGQTVKWVMEGIEGSHKARERANFNRTPTLLFTAGLDEIVLPAGQRHFCALSVRCELVEFNASRHEILQETDSIRDQALERIVKFFRAH